MKIKHGILPFTFILIMIVLVGCGEKIVRTEYSTDKKYVLVITSKPQIPFVAYNLYAIVKRVTDNQPVSEKVWIDSVDAPIDVERLSIKLWEENKVILLKDSEFRTEIKLKVLIRSGASQ